MTDHQLAWNMFAGHDQGTRDDLIQAGYSFTALKGSTFMEPEAVTGTALYLNSHLADHVTGVAVPVDSGHLLLIGINPNPVK